MTTNPEPIVIAQFDAWLAGFKSGRAGSWTIEFGMEPTAKNEAFRVTDCEGVRLTVMVLVDSGAVGLMSSPPTLELEAAEIRRTPTTTPTAAEMEMPDGWDVERDAMTNPHPIPPHPAPAKRPPRNPAQIIAEANARIHHTPTPTPATTPPPTITPQ